MLPSTWDREHAAIDKIDGSAANGGTLTKN